MTIYHKHHIIPKHMGGSDDPSNLKTITVAEHAEEHRLLYEQHGHWQDFLAWKGLSGMLSHEEIIIEAMKNKRTNKGMSISQEHKERLSAGYTNWWNTLDESEKEKHRAKLRHPNSKPKKVTELELARRETLSKNQMGSKNHFFGKKHSEETKEKIRIAMRAARLKKFSID